MEEKIFVDTFVVDLTKQLRDYFGHDIPFDIEKTPYGDVVVTFEAHLIAHVLSYEMTEAVRDNLAYTLFRTFIIFKCA